MQKQTAPWRDPVRALAALPEMEGYCLLYSGLIGDGFGRYSLLAAWPKETVTGDDWSRFSPEGDTWFGYLGYGLKDSLETLPADNPSGLFPLPNLWMSRYHLVAHFDHFDKNLTLHATDQSYIDTFLQEPVVPRMLPRTPLGKNLRSNMTKADYLKKVATTKEAITRGDVYQANITRKFTGEWVDGAPSPVQLFNALARVSPAPYSALIKCGDTHILSSSPELFIAVTAEGKIISRPIKGSAPRAMKPEEDKKIREDLAASEKNRAENLMIVDLMRNDLSRVSEPGSVKTDSLFDITSYMTVHHMSSTVTGRKRADASALDVVKACFPPGSMTGAPKIAAVKLCTELEQDARGVYSGAIGFFGEDGSAHLSVVIRTLLMNDTHFEFQVGGGIVADSTPEGEWLETLVKARGIAGALNIPESELAVL